MLLKKFLRTSAIASILSASALSPLNAQDLPSPDQGQRTEQRQPQEDYGKRSASVLGAEEQGTSDKVTVILVGPDKMHVGCEDDDAMQSYEGPC